MSVLHSRRARVKVGFVLLTAVALASCLVLIRLASHLGEWADEVAAVPLLLTAWIAAGSYRRRHAGERWVRRVAVVMGTAGLLGTVGTVIAVTPWTEWPDATLLFHHALFVVAGTAVWTSACVAFAWLSDRHRLRLRHRSRARH